MGKQRLEALTFHVLKRRGPEVPTDGRSNGAIMSQIIRQFSLEYDEPVELGISSYIYIYYIIHIYIYN